MLGAGLFGFYLQIMVDTGDIAREEVSKGVGEDQHSAWVCYMDLGQHGFIVRVHAGLGHKSTQNQTLNITFQLLRKLILLLIIYN